MISALATGFALSGLLLAVVHRVQPRPRPAPVRIRDARSRRGPDA